MTDSIIRLLVKVVLLVTLGGEAILDHRLRLVKLWWMLPAAAVSSIHMILCRQWHYLIGCIVILIIGSLLSIPAKAGIGMGDVLILGLMAMALGFQLTMAVFLGALLGAAIYGGVKILCRKAVIRDTVAFVPFLLLAYVGSLYAGAV